MLSVGFSPDGKLLVSGAGDLTLRLWSVEGGREIRRMEGAHSDPVASVALSQDGKWLASASWSGEIKLWKLEGVGPAPTLDTTTP